MGAAARIKDALGRVGNRLHEGRGVDFDRRTFGSDPSTVAGVAAAALGMPVVLSLWAPGWSWIVFLVVYLLVEIGAMFLVRRFPDRARSIHQTEVIAAAVVFTVAVPISIRVFAEDPDEWVWLVGAVAIAFASTEAAVKAHLPMADWRLGCYLFVAACMALVVYPYAGALISAGMTLVVASSIDSGTRTANTNRRLAEARSRAEAQRAYADEQREVAEDQASRDALTDLLNRRGLTIELEANTAEPMSVIIIDADRFKSINDTWGHGVGDEALRSIAAALRERLGPAWRLGRLGGDEFAAVARGYHRMPPNLTEKIAFDPGLTSHPVALELGLSAGLTHSEGDATVDQLLSEASYALRLAKKTPGVQMRTLEGALHTKYERMSEVRSMLDASFTAGEFTTVVQPIVDTRHGIVGGELLARWKGEDGQVLLPKEFLPLLAEAGMLLELGSHMLELAVGFAARFRHLVHGPYTSVNLSASHLALPELVPYVRSLLERHQVAADRLLIEITESESLVHVDGWEVSAKALRSLGVGLAIDDFGSGYSNIERITSLPVSHLKLDQSFTTRISGAYGEIVRGLVNFANATHLGVVAEGIETFDQKVAMEAIGVHTMQGFWFAKPMSRDDFEQAVLADRSNSHSALRD